MRSPRTPRRVWQRVLGRKTAAVDDEIGIARCLALAEPKLDAFRLKLVEQEVQRRLRREVTLVWEKQAGLETASERGLEGFDPLLAQADMTDCHPLEAIKLSAIAREREHERAVGLSARVMLAPEREPALPESSDRGLGTLLLAVRRQHGAGIEAAREGEGFGRTLAERHFVAAPGEDIRLPESHDTSAADRYRFRLLRHRFVNLRRPGLRAACRRRPRGYCRSRR